MNIFSTDVTTLLERIKQLPPKPAPAYAELIDIYEERHDRWTAKVDGEDVIAGSLYLMMVEIELRSCRRPVVVHLKWGTA